MSIISQKGMPKIFTESRVIKVFISEARGGHFGYFPFFLLVLSYYK